MTKPLLIIGAGGHGRVLAELAVCLGRQILGFLDEDIKLHNNVIDGFKVLGGDELLTKYSANSVLLVNGIGSIVNTKKRYEAYSRFKNLGYQFEILCHPKAIVSHSAFLAQGAQIMAGCVIQSNAQVGENSILNTGVIVEHDVIVGSHCHLAPRVVICGNVCIGERSHIGVGAVVIQGLTIGNDALVAAGAVVVKNVSSKSKVLGVPAHIV
jgi:sugar O-acyltransferase (sialic acid O-acetyltransferase NeuD family)